MILPVRDTYSRLRESVSNLFGYEGLMNYRIDTKLVAAWRIVNYVGR
tara:strand:+ start:356 stop:496 length:141 start_codon:yes stop_codon:yes gene_type:complete